MGLARDCRFLSFSPKSSLVISNLCGEGFTASIASTRINATLGVWTYGDSQSFADFIEDLSSQAKPWQGTETWESIEGEFKLSATCSNLGEVTFRIVLSDNDCPEPWQVTTGIKQGLGELTDLARSARKFFSPSPD
jgi:Family of unknown function (DUF6228)